MAPARSAMSRTGAVEAAAREEVDGRIEQTSPAWREARSVATDMNERLKDLFDGRKMKIRPALASTRARGRAVGRCGFRWLALRPWGPLQAAPDASTLFAPRGRLLRVLRAPRRADRRGRKEFVKLVDGRPEREGARGPHQGDRARGRRHHAHAASSAAQDLHHADRSRRHPPADHAHGRHHGLHRGGVASASRSTSCAR